MIFEFDDFGSNHVISDMCRSRDCRTELDRLHLVNPAFKATLFAIPGEMTPELLKWCDANQSWIELAIHGIFHSSNYECEKMTYEEFDMWMEHSSLRRVLNGFVKGFRAPGWQISDDVYRWLADHGWWVADQGYNDDRRPKSLPAYVNYNGAFAIYKGSAKLELNDPNFGWIPGIKAHHGHVWNTCGNGIEEQFDYLSELVSATKEFKFVSEAINENS